MKKINQVTHGYTHESSLTHPGNSDVSVFRKGLDFILFIFLSGKRSEGVPAMSHISCLLLLL